MQVAKLGGSHAITGKECGPLFGQGQFTQPELNQRFKRRGPLDIQCNPRLLRGLFSQPNRGQRAGSITDSLPNAGQDAEAVEGAVGVSKVTAGAKG